MLIKSKIKRLGFFPTPDEYLKISTEYLRNTIKRVPEGYDYIILDRCAGTGNLEKFLTAEELSHSILNTYVYAEWEIITELYGNRARCIIPHTKDYKDADGLLSDGDALTEEFDTKLTEIIDEERRKAGGKLVVIGMENPPYRDETTNAKNTKSASSTITKSHVYELTKQGVGSIKARDLANQFIYSMIDYADEYIVFAPIKYWKSQKIFDGKFNEGHLCNRKHFHASEAAVTLISWTVDTKHSNHFLDFTTDIDEKKVQVEKLRIPGHNKMLDKKTESTFCYMMDQACMVNAMSGGLYNIAQNQSHVSYTGLNESNVKAQLPLWASNYYKPKEYTEKEVIMKSGDGGLVFQDDKDFQDDCFVWSCLTAANKCISTDTAINEMCLSQDTEADKLLDISKRHIDIMAKWNHILKEAKTKNEYDFSYTYGLYQICKDINTKMNTGSYTKTGDPIKAFRYPELNQLIKEFKVCLNEFYEEHITGKMFEYELLK